MVSILLTLNSLPLLMLATGEVKDRLDLYLTPPLTSYVMPGELLSPQPSASSAPGITPANPTELRIQWGDAYKKFISFPGAVNSKNHPPIPSALHHITCPFLMWLYGSIHQKGKAISPSPALKPGTWPAMVNATLTNVKSAWNLCTLNTFSLGAL